MKKIILIIIGVIGIITACNNASNNNRNVSTGSLEEKVRFFHSATDSINHSNKMDSSLMETFDWEMEEPFVEKGCTILYRNSFLEYIDSNIYDVEVLSYYLYQHGTALYDSALQQRSFITVDDLFKSCRMSDSSFYSIPLKNIPLQWYPIRYYRGNPYIYFDDICGIYISPKAIFSVCSDIGLYQLKEIKEQPNGNYIFSIVNDYNEIITSTIQLIDPSIGIYYIDKILGHEGLYTNDVHISKYDIIYSEGYGYTVTSDNIADSNNIDLSIQIKKK
ncbi:MAG: hypothetical protein IKD33_03575 [Bacteroidales bacterium]|nr:hypothetical protein [Bacteroidales bacterium]